MAQAKTRKRKLHEAFPVRPRVGGKSIGTLQRVFPGLSIKVAVPDSVPPQEPSSLACATVMKPDSFRCIACPIQAADHILCLPTHPCLWNAANIARRAHAQRRVWLRQPPSKNCNGRVSRAYGRIVDEHGVEEVRMMIVPSGEKPWEAWNQYVEKMFALVLLPSERGQRASRTGWEEDRVRRGRWLNEL